HHWFFWLVLPVTAYAASFYLLTRVRKRKDSLDKRETDLDLRIQNLKSNQSQLAASISASFHETWSWTEQANEFWCSESFWRVFGYTAESEFPLAQYEVFLNHLGAGNRESWEAAIERHLQENKPIDLKVRTRNQLGFSRWCESRPRP
ncbi:MAG: PAS domain-containing protein, partial [Gimesia chilikensis]